MNKPATPAMDADDRVYTDDELGDELIERLRDFSPALSIQEGEDDDQVEVRITMCRTSRPRLRVRD